MKTILLPLLCTTALLLTGLVNAQDDVLFRVVTDTVLNLRACGSRDCARVGQVPAGAELPVHAIEGDWYQVLVDGELVWAAGWLTTRLPESDPTPTGAKLLTMGEIREDAVTGCNLLVGKVADEAGDLALLLAGDGRQEVRVDVYPPGAAAPLPLADSRDSEADVMGNPVIVRIWPESVRWPAGRYRFELGLGEAEAEFEWEMPGPGEYSLLVDCEQPASASATGDLPPQLFLTEEVYHDRGDTGCNLFLSEGEGPEGIEIVFVGDRRREAQADLFLPDDDTALQPEPDRKYGQFDDGEAYVALQYPRKADWRTGLYRIELELGDTGSAFVWHMERLGRYFLFVDCEGPASLPATGEASLQLLVNDQIYRDPETGCSLFMTALQGQAGLDLLIIGERRREARVELFLPKEQRALLPERVQEEDQPAEGEAHVAHFYSRDAGWRPGLYRIEVDLGGVSSAFAWEMERLGKYALLIDCDAPSSGGAGSERGPVMLELGESHHDPVTGCIVILFPESADEDLNLVIQGGRQEEVVARVFRPDAERPLAADGRLNRTYTESGRPYKLQFYDAEQGWPAGLYRLELELEGQVGEFTWHMEAPRDQSLLIYCDDEPPGSEAAGVPVGPTPTPPVAEPEQAGPLFHVATNNTLNLRSCASADCERVGQVPGGTNLPVYAVEGDWYQALVNGELVWVAGWLTTRAPDMFLEDTSMILDERTGCTFLLGARQLFDVLHIMVGGERHEDLRFEFYAPGESEPLSWSDRSVVELEDSGTMIEHVYQDVLLSAGQPYRLLVELDDGSNLVEWTPAQSGGTAIFIICNDPEDVDLGTGPGPISSAATQIAQVPAEGADERATPAPPVMLTVGDTLRDVQSGCVVRLAPDSPGEDFDVVLSGERRAEIEVRVFQPGADGPLPVSGGSEMVLIEGEAPVIRQYYSGDQDWPWGLYRLEVELDGRVSAYLWRMEAPTDQFFLILCDETRATSPTPAPSTPAAEAAAPRLLETDVAWRDDHTGCELLVSDRRLDGDLNIWITSDRPQDVGVRVFRPGESSQLPFDGRFRDEVEEADLPLEWQYYESDDSWPEGTWELEVTLDGATSRFAWQLENQGDQIITILCVTSDRDLSLAEEPPEGQEQASVEPTPPRVLETDVFYRDDHTGCDIIIDPEPLDGDLNLALAGDRYRDIEARVYRLGSDTPLRYTDRLDDFFTESEEPFIWQYYSVTTPLDDGLYLLEVELDGRTTLAYWNLERGGDQLIYVFCNTEENSLPVATLTPTLTVTPSPTPGPTVTPTPTLTRTPVPTRVRELQTGRDLRDYITGCELYIDPEGLDGHLHLVLTGDRREEIEAVVYRPNGLRVDYTRQTHETFDDADEEFVWQIYGDFTAWAAGLYRLAITLEDRTSELFWKPEREGDQVIYIDCDGALPRATITPRPTLTYTPSPTSTPSPTWTPSPTPTPTPEEVAADVRTGAVHKDEATGCTLLVLEFPPEQVDWKDLWITFGGSERDAVEVDVWLPDAAAPLPVDEFYEDVMETGESLLVQGYSPRTDWRNGLYRFDLSLAGDSSSLTWRMSGPGYYAVSVTCDRAPGPAPSV